MGLCYTKGVYKGNLISSVYGYSEYEEETYSTIGIPVSVSLMLGLNFVKFGLSGFGNLNFKKSFYGWGLNVQLNID